jgi:hypothetical protein
MLRSFSMQERRLFFFLALFQIFFLAFSIGNGHTITADSAEYLVQASNLLDHKVSYCGDLTRPLNLALYTHRPPGYAMFLIMTGSGHSPFWFSLFIQSVLVMISIFTGHRLLRLISNGNGAGRLYLVSFFFFPSLFIYAGMFMAEVLLAFLIVHAIYFQIIFHLKRNVAALWYSFLFTAFALLVKPVAILLLLVQIVVLLFSVKFRSAIRNVLPPLLVPLLVLGFYVYRNYQQTGVAEYSSVGRRLMLNYTLPALSDRTQGRQVYNSQMDSLSLGTNSMNYNDRVRAEQQFIRQQIADAPASFLLVELKGLLRYLTDPGRWDWNCWQYGFEKAEQSESLAAAWREGGLSSFLKAWSRGGWIPGMYMILVFMAACVNSVWCIRFFRQQTTALYVRLLFGLLILGFALASGPSASARFRVPVYPLIAVMVSMAVFSSAVNLRQPLPNGSDR